MPFISIILQRLGGRVNISYWAPLWWRSLYEAAQIEESNAVNILKLLKYIINYVRTKSMPCTQLVLSFGELSVIWVSVIV